MLDKDDWECKWVKATSPLGLFVANGGKVPHSWPPGMMGVSRGYNYPLIDYLAEKGFFQMKGTILNRICRELDLPVFTKEPLGDQLFRLVKHILKCTDEKVIHILEDRLATCVSAVERDEREYANAPGAKKGMKTDEAEEVDNYEETAEKRASARESIVIKIRSHWRKHRFWETEGAAGSGGHGAVAFHGDRTMSSSHAKKCCPNGFSIRRDNIAKRWQVQLSGRVSVSPPFLLSWLDALRLFAASVAETCLRCPCGGILEMLSVKPPDAAWYLLATTEVWHTQ